MILQRVGEDERVLRREARACAGRVGPRRVVEMLNVPPLAGSWKVSVRGSLRRGGRCGTDAAAVTAPARAILERACDAPEVGGAADATPTRSHGRKARATDGVRSRADQRVDAFDPVWCCVGWADARTGRRPTSRSPTRTGPRRASRSSQASASSCTSTPRRIHPGAPPRRAACATTP